jgi:hypothetical protein
MTGLELKILLEHFSDEELNMPIVFNDSVTGWVHSLSDLEQLKERWFFIGDDIYTENELSDEKLRECEEWHADFLDKNTFVLYAD